MEALFAVLAFIATVAIGVIAIYYPSKLRALFSFADVVRYRIIISDLRAQVREYEDARIDIDNELIAYADHCEGMASVQASMDKKYAAALKKIEQLKADKAYHKGLRKHTDRKIAKLDADRERLKELLTQEQSQSQMVHASYQIAHERANKAQAELNLKTRALGELERKHRRLSDTYDNYSRHTDALLWDITQQRDMYRSAFKRAFARFKLTKDALKIEIAEHEITSSKLEITQNYASGLEQAVQGLPGMNDNFKPVVKTDTIHPKAAAYLERKREQIQYLKSV